MNASLEDLRWTEEARAYLKEIRKNLKSDLAPPSGRFFSHETFEALSTEAFDRLAEKLPPAPSPITLESLRLGWQEVVTDFYRSDRWGFPTQDNKPAKILTEQDKIRKEMWPYIWVVIQSMIILKTVVYYFGIKSSDDPTLQNKIFLGLALATSAFTLTFFAWRKSRK